VGQLRAVSVAPSAALVALRRCWDAGDAALLLDPTAADAVTAAVLGALRPASIEHLGVDGSVTARHDLPDAVPIDDDVALVVATSGSTGRPKGVELTHAALHTSVSASLARLGAAPGERWALTLPTHHVAGVAVHLRAAALGTDAVAPDTLERLDPADVEHLAVVPTQLVRLLEAGVALSRLRTVLVGGAAMPPALLARARAADVPLVTSYGMSETCGGCVYDGVPLDGVEVDVDGRRRVRLRGAVTFARYRLDPGATAETLGDDGWLTTGDVGRVVDGRLVVEGRADDVAVSGGENVPLAAVASVLAEHPAVLDVAVTARPDEQWGQRVVAVVVGELDLLQAKDHVRRSLPAAWAPREVIRVAALPRDKMGKLPAARLAALVDGAAGT
jgi:o-succinylbenzoate---CoA ligase